MKERFETTLKAVTKEEISKEEQEAVDMIERFVDTETMDHIRQLQLEKVDLVAELKQWRKKFWDEGDMNQSKSILEDKPGSKTLYAQDGIYQMFTSGGETLTLSKGEVMSASEWGFWWKFDDSVPREDQISIMSKQVRNVIAGKYDRQLIEYGSVDTLSDEYKHETYKAIKEKNLNLETMPSGILAEKMITSLLIKQMYDNPSLSFRFKSVDVYEDVEHKIDFILELKDYARGVKVGEPHSFGIQFTLNPNATAKKEQQIDRVKRTAGHEITVDDIMLITIPINDVKEKYEIWSAIKKSKRDPRGPDNLWSEETKRTIIEGLLNRIDTAQHINTTAVPLKTPQP